MIEIPFHELTSGRFDDLSRDIIEKEFRPIECNPYGKSGNDGGIDIHFVVRCEDGSEDNWYAQCKRYQKLHKRDVVELFNNLKITQHHTQTIFLLITSCNINRANTDLFKELAIKKGFQKGLVWSKDQLKSKLTVHHQDLLHKYFGENYPTAIRTKEKIIELRNKMRDDFYIRRFTALNPHDVDGKPYDKFFCNDVLIRLINHEDYAENKEVAPGIYEHHKYGPFDIRSNGFEVIKGIKLVAMNKFGDWDFVTEISEELQKRFDILRCWQVARIPFDNIVCYDIVGDEYCDYPIIYCKYDCDGSPFESIDYFPFKHENTGKPISMIGRKLDTKKRMQLI